MDKVGYNGVSHAIMRLQNREKKLQREVDERGFVIIALIITLLIVGLGLG